VRAIHEGRPHVATGEVGYHVLDIMLSAEESAERGEFVTVDSSVSEIPAVPADFDPKASTISAASLHRPPRPRRLPRRPDHLILRPQPLPPGGARREIVPIRRGSSRGGTGADGTESAERSRRGLRPVSDVIPASRYVSVSEFGPASHRSPSLAT